MQGGDNVECRMLLPLMKGEAGRGSTSISLPSDFHPKPPISPIAKMRGYGMQVAMAWSAVCSSLMKGEAGRGSYIHLVTI